MSIETVYAEFSRRLSPFGRIVLAGGAVRDSLMAKEPKDWDIFILQGAGFDYAATKDKVMPILSDLDKGIPVVAWHKSEPFLVETVKWNGAEVQVLVSPQPTKEALVATFDWNVCLFAYDGEYHKGESLDNIGPGKVLRLQSLTYPMSSLRRGFRFSERFEMQLERGTVEEICRRIVTDADAREAAKAAKAGAR